MPLDLVFRNLTGQRAYGPRFFTRVLRVASKHLGLGRQIIELSITVAGPSRMRALNKRYRSIDVSTDVLSFPLHGTIPKAGLGGSSAKRYTIHALGDIFICPSVARRQALEEGTSLQAALAWLTVHGFLHLMGYDHERSVSDRAAMVALEKKILKTLCYDQAPHHRRN